MSAPSYLLRVFSLFPGISYPNLLTIILCALCVLKSRGECIKKGENQYEHRKQDFKKRRPVEN